MTIIIIVGIICEIKVIEILFSLTTDFRKKLNPYTPPKLMINSINDMKLIFSYLLFKFCHNFFSYL